MAEWIEEVALLKRIVSNPIADGFALREEPPSKDKNPPTLPKHEFRIHVPQSYVTQQVHDLSCQSNLKKKKKTNDLENNCEILYL